jgi:hypothetical protein
MSNGERTRYYQVRPRRIPPEFCSDELLEECSVLAALLMYRLVSQADDQGRQPGHPKSVRAMAFPMRPLITVAKVDAALAELSRAGFLIRYDVAGRSLIQIARWFDMQGKWGQRRTYPSRYPAPPGWTDDWVNAGKDAQEVHALGAQGAGNLPPPSSLASSFSSTASLSGLGSADPRTSDPRRYEALVELAVSGNLTEEEALELGTRIADSEMTHEARSR